MGEKYKDDEVILRPAKKEDMVAVAALIQELADFEKMPDGPKISSKELQRDGFESQPPAFRCLVAELPKQASCPVVGYALYFPTYSTWEGSSMMLEDLYVATSERRRGIGERLFNAVAKELGDYQKMVNGPKMSAKELQRDGFERSPAAFQCFVAEVGAGRVAGYALCYGSYSAWQGRSMVLENLCVAAAHRRRGLGARLLRRVAQVLVDKLDFHVLQWNDARVFYEGKGAVNLTEKEQWCCYRLSGPALQRAAGP